eukprot:1372611-Amorphochlora_amoeboformis.AAC.1
MFQIYVYLKISAVHTYALNREIHVSYRFAIPLQQVLPAEKFYYAEEYHQQYDAKPGSRQYCGLRPLQVSMPKVEGKSNI